MRGEGARVVLSFRIVGISSQLEADPGSGDKVRRAAQERAAREREARIAAAQERMRELETERARREKTNKQEVARQKEPRASTTDAEARVMKMVDSGFRPAYNTQIVAEPKSQLIVAVDIDTSGSDRGLARPAIEALRARGYSLIRVGKDAMIGALTFIHEVRIIIYQYSIIWHGFSLF